MADSHLFSCLGDPLDTQDFSNAIAAATSKPVHQGGIGTRLTLRSLRHFESAILNSDWLRPHLVQHRSTVGDLLADLQAGHTTDMADGHYGVVSHRLPHLRMHDVTGYIAVSVVVHRWWRLVPGDLSSTPTPPEPAVALQGSQDLVPWNPSPSFEPTHLVDLLLSRLIPTIHSVTRECVAEATASLARTFLPRQHQDAPAPTIPEFDWSPPGTDCLVALRSLTGDPLAQFRSPEQALAVQHVLERRSNLLLVTPTGSGKSLAFLLPMHVDRKRGVSGLNLVVAPYALLCGEIRDRASSIGLSSLSYGPEVTVGHLLDLDCLTCTPDALESTHLREMLATVAALNGLARIFVDEAHHVLHSAEFRPVFAHLASLRDSPVPVVLLTATLPPDSVPSLLRSLSLTSCPVLRTASSRPSLRLAVTRLSSESLPGSFLAHLESHRASLLTGEVGMVFCNAVADVDLLAQSVPNSTKCHSQMPWEDQRASLASFRSPGGPNVMVATSVLGNGLDVPNVRFVLHYGSPRSVVDYLQESGRAGRDGLPSSSHVFSVLSPDGQETHPESRGLGVAEMRDWIGRDDLCRRWGITLFADGRGETCTSLPGSVPCDVCELRLSLLVPGMPEVELVLPEGGQLQLQVVQPQIQALPGVQDDPLVLPPNAFLDLQAFPLPLPLPNMDVFIDQQVHLGRRRDADEERLALTRVLDRLLEEGLCVGCWCRGREGRCRSFQCITNGFFVNPEFREFKRLLVLPTAHCWFCGFPQVSLRLDARTSSHLFFAFLLSLSHLQRPTGYHVPDRPKHDTCRYRDMLRPLAFCLWAFPDVLDAVARHLDVRVPLDTLPRYVQWLLTQSDGPAEFLQFVGLPLVVNEILRGNEATRRLAVAL